MEGGFGIQAKALYNRASTAAGSSWLSKNLVVVEISREKHAIDKFLRQA